MIYKNTSSSFALYLLCLLAWAWSPAATLYAANEQKVFFRTFGWQTLPTDLYYENTGKDVSIEVLDSTRSRFYPVETTSPVVFYRLETAADGKKKRVPVVTVDLSQNGRWPLLIMMPDSAKGPGALRIVPLADDPETFPAPKFHFVNFTPVMIGLTLGKERIPVPPQEVRLIDPSVKSGTAAETRYFMVSIASEEGPKMLYANNWVVRPLQRTLVLIFAADGALQVRRVTETPSQLQDPAAPRLKVTSP